ncbi:hypothetical protein ACU686_37855 [Yinghuangia aomiensis]
MRALSDQDHPVLERWAGMADADTSVVQDVHLGGRPVCLIGIESRAVSRRGFPPTDGPDAYTAGTLFPQSSKKTARALNAASGNPAGGGAGEPVGLRRFAGVDAEAPAGVRRGDQARGRRLTDRADRCSA